MSMEEAAAKTTSPVAVAPLNPTDRLDEVLEMLGHTVDTLQNCAHRTHEKTYGEYSYGPRAEADVPEMGGRIGELQEKVKAIHSNAQLALEVVESMESKG